jgi:hypothetical protein
LEILLIIGIAIAGIYWVIHEEAKQAAAAAVAEVKKQIYGLANSTSELTPEEFFQLRNNGYINLKDRGIDKTVEYNFPGVYILRNESKHMYYVGQGMRALDRVNAHFTGKGNGDIYADYKYGIILQ